jgi:hypothetical protein
MARSSHEALMICEDDLLLVLELAHDFEAAASQPIGMFYSFFDTWNEAQALTPDLAIINRHLADGESSLHLATHLVEQGCKRLCLAQTGPHGAHISCLSYACVQRREGSPWVAGKIYRVLTRWRFSV